MCPSRDRKDLTVMTFGIVLFTKVD